MAYITINKDHFYYNLDQLTQKVGSVDKIAIVLKDNAYGHGLELIAALAQEYGIQHAVVKNTQEAQLIKERFKTTLILNDTPVEDSRLYYTINSLEALQRVTNQAHIELKIDTGMHRNGIAMEEIEEAIAIIKNRELNLKGVMTHYRSADELSTELFWQQKNFQKAIQMLKSAKLKAFRIHAQNSAATLRLNHFSDDMVRIGISAYGYNELPAPFEHIKLKPVMALYASRTASRYLPKGTRIGYGAENTLLEDSPVSSYDIGYGHGWLRATKNMPLPNDLQLLGRVSMDFISINSDADTVCIMDDAKEVATYCGTISYEITTRLDHKIQRQIV